MSPLLPIIMLKLQKQQQLFGLHLNEPRCEKTGLRGFRPGMTQTGLYIKRRWLEA